MDHPEAPLGRSPDEKLRLGVRRFEMSATVAAVVLIVVLSLFFSVLFSISFGVVALGSVVAQVEIWSRVRFGRFPQRRARIMTQLILLATAFLEAGLIWLLVTK
jgi:hypothetical protein